MIDKRQIGQDTSLLCIVKYVNRYNVNKLLHNLLQSLEDARSRIIFGAQKNCNPFDSFAKIIINHFLSYSMYFYYF